MQEWFETLGLTVFSYQVEPYICAQYNTSPALKRVRYSSDDAGHQHRI